MASPKFPVIPEPFANTQALYGSVMAMKEGVEMLSGQRGDAKDCAVTWGDLVRLGIVKPDQVPPHVRSSNIR